MFSSWFRRFAKVSKLTRPGSDWLQSSNFWSKEVVHERDRVKKAAYEEPNLTIGVPIWKKIGKQHVELSYFTMSRATRASNWRFFSKKTYQVSYHVTVKHKLYSTMQISSKITNWVSHYDFQAKIFELPILL